MKPPENFVKIIGQKKYSTRSATLLAGDDFWDGHNFERHGRNTFLYRTTSGAYFTVNLTQWQGERDTLVPVTLDEAIDLFEGTLTEHRVPYREAFPGVEIKDA
jgi:hypothetical protein